MDVVDLSVALGEKVLIFRLGVVICVGGGGGRWWERCVGISSAVVERWRGCAWKVVCKLVVSCLGMCCALYGTLDESQDDSLLLLVVSFSSAHLCCTHYCSQSLSSLTLIEKFLSARPIPHSKLSENGTIEYSSARWKKDVNYFREF